jgi:hypothetical protein
MDRVFRRKPTPYEQKRVNITGRKRSTFEVVSSIITAKQYVMRVEPERTAAAPKIETVSLLMLSPVM